MTVREVIEKLELYAKEYGDDIPVRTFDLDRDMEDITEIEFCQNYDLDYYIYRGKNMIENIITRIGKLKPHPTEAIVIGFNFNDTNVDEMNDIFNHIKSQFPNNKVIAIPDYISLQSCSKDVLENIISMISKIIDEL